MKQAKRKTYSISFIQGNKYIECEVCGRRSFVKEHIDKKICPFCGRKHK